MTYPDVQFNATGLVGFANVELGAGAITTVTIGVREVQQWTTVADSERGLPVAAIAYPTFFLARYKILAVFQHPNAACALICSVSLRPPLSVQPLSEHQQLLPDGPRFRLSLAHHGRQEAIPDDAPEMAIRCPPYFGNSLLRKAEVFILRLDLQLRR
ncbi:hypothetical protein GN958_ATG16077 [Phytophthora infestans]|uniref:Uncharacterized protein n=1 Tax=Phytophthora infestans TaxID=4787 RepID=A0A8S9U1M0_PHYIN|nr:hypothetical protein GN958_ATG16077 [Phytophthora infestans]